MTRQANEVDAARRWDWESRATSSPDGFAEEGASGMTSDSSLPSPGDYVNETDRIVRVLGEGSLGVVFETFDAQLEQTHAIKFLSPKLSFDGEMRRIFREGFRTMATVEHGSIVPVVRCGQWRGLPYFTMPLIDGVDLRKRMNLHRGEPMNLEDARDILNQLCAAIGAVHAAGHAHLGLGAHNILLGRGRRVFVSDVGLSRHEPYADGGSLPPHRSGARRIDVQRAEAAYRDVVAIAAIAFEMLTGSAPTFERATVSPHRKRAQELFARPTKASELNGALGSQIDEILGAALGTYGDYQIESVEQLAEYLEQAFRALALHPPQTRIVLVDDDESMLNLLAHALGRALVDAEIVRASDGAGALAALAAGPVHLLVTDLEMPDLNGLELIATARADRRLAPERCMVVTGRGSAEDWRVLSGLGVDAFLTKPFRPSQATALIRELLSEPAGDAERRDLAMIG